MPTQDMPARLAASHHRLQAKQAENIKNSGGLGNAENSEQLLSDKPSWFMPIFSRYRMRGALWNCSTASSMPPPSRMRPRCRRSPSGLFSKSGSIGLVLLIGAGLLRSPPSSIACWSIVPPDLTLSNSSSNSKQAFFPSL